MDGNESSTSTLHGLIVTDVCRAVEVNKKDRIIIMPVVFTVYEYCIFIMPSDAAILKTNYTTAEELERALRGQR